MRETGTHRIFKAALTLKAVDSFLEVAGGAALLIVPVPAVVRLVMELAHQKPIEDLQNWFGIYLSQASLIPGQKAFAAYFLLSHGAIKLFLVVAVLRGKLWAYPVFMTVLAALVVYQSYRLAQLFTIILTTLTIVDAVTLALTWHEYRR